MCTKCSRTALCGAMFLLLVSVAVSFGQTIFGRISGEVTDPSGAAVVGAKVTITNVATLSSRTLTTDAKGFYSADNLPVGTYSVQVEEAGFRSEAQSGVAVAADARVTADFHLQLGNVSQTVDVSAQSVQLNTVSGEVAHVIDNRQVENLPLNGRNYMQLLTLEPGAVVTNPDQFSVMTTLSATNQVVNGHRSNQNNMTVDRLGNLDAGANGSLINNVSPDFMQQVKNSNLEFLGGVRPFRGCGIQPGNKERH